MLAIIETEENDDKKRILTRWYKQHRKVMRKIAYDMTGDYHMANDLVNEAFIKIISNFDKISGLSKAERSFYVVNTVKSVSIDYLRKKQIESKYVQPCSDEDNDEISRLVDEKPTPLQVYESKEFFDNIEKYVKGLSPRDAELIVYRCLWEMSDKEIASALGINQDSVSSYVRRAKNRLIKLMNEEVEE